MSLLSTPLRWTPKCTVFGHDGKGKWCRYTILHHAFYAWCIFFLSLPYPLMTWSCSPHYNFTYPFHPSPWLQCCSSTRLLPVHLPLRRRRIRMRTIRRFSLYRRHYMSHFLSWASKSVLTTHIGWAVRVLPTCKTDYSRSSWWIPIGPYTQGICFLMFFLPFDPASFL